MDWSDIVNADTSTAEGYNSLAEGLYLSYRHAKRKWRTFSGPRRKRKGKGKGKSNGKRKGHHGQAYWVDEANDESDPWSAFFKGGKGGGKQGGKRPFVRTGNPVDSSGVQLKCSICDSTAHFRASCPQNKSGGKGTGKGHFPAFTPPAPASTFQVPSAGTSSYAGSSAASSGKRPGKRSSAASSGKFPQLELSLQSLA